MIDKETKDAWVAALRSGKYKQTTGALRNDTGYCCLGVLAEVMTGPTGWRRSGFFNDYAHPLKKPYKGLLLSRILPEATQELLSDMNDGCDSFAEIANWIETNLEVEK
jgi:hypothetical protein